MDIDLQDLGIPGKADINHPPLWRNLYLPFKNPNFRRFLTFAILWNFSVNFASPFFTLYFLRDLRFSYGFIALLAVISSFADLLGMQIWGWISNKVRNLVHKPEAKGVAHMIRIIQNIRGLNVATGFNSILHPFIILNE